jgi:gamma-tubulin complex component 5
MSDGSTPSLSPWDNDLDDLDDDDSFPYTEDAPSSPDPLERVSSYGQPNLSFSYQHRRLWRNCKLDSTGEKNGEQMPI